VAYPKHIKIVFRGVFTGTPETWSFGQHFRSTVDLGQDAHASDVHVENLPGIWQTYFGSATMQCPSSAKLTDVRAYEIGANGRMVGNPNIIDCSADNIHGASSVVYPPQIALVMTHVANDRGPARFGRCFLPTSAAVGADFRLSTSICDQIMGGYVQFAKDVSDEVDLQGGESSDMINVSNASVDGISQVIDHVEVGRALDTLRSRRRSLLEERRVGTHIDW